MSQLETAIGDGLRRYMAEHNLTVDDIAKRAYMGAKRVQNLLDGKPVTMDTIERVCMVIGARIELSKPPGRP